MLQKIFWPKFLNSMLARVQKCHFARIEKLPKFKAEPVYEGGLKGILLLQVNSHDFEPTFIIFCLNWRILPDQPK